MRTALVVCLVMGTAAGCGSKGQAVIVPDGGLASDGSSTTGGQIPTVDAADGSSTPTGGTPTTSGGTIASGGKTVPTGGNTGGTVAATGGILVRTGGLSSTTGGSVLPTGGTVGRTGGATIATGGIIATGGASPSTGGAPRTGGQTAPRDAAATDAPTAPSDARPAASDGGFSPGNPNGACKTTLPARAQRVDTSAPTTVVGTGTPASCTFAQLKAAVAGGGIITFDCGASPVTIPVAETLKAPIAKNTVIDGRGVIVLDGGNAAQILRFDSPNFEKTAFGVTVQGIHFTNGKATPTASIPTAPAPCSQGFTDGQGGAIYVRDGFLTVIDCLFTNNTAAQIGPDTGGGAIYMLGSKDGLVVAGSTFTGNTASNAGAIGCLFSDLSVYNSLFSGNLATGHDANDIKPAECSVGDGQVGSGGNGGALYSDGNGKNVVLCGNAIVGNKAGQNACGGGVFFTSNNMTGTLSIADTSITGNTGCSWTNVAGGTVKNAGSAVGTNCKSITISNSTLQGL